MYGFSSSELQNSEQGAAPYLRQQAEGLCDCQHLFHVLRAASSDGKAPSG